MEVAGEVGSGKTYFILQIFVLLTLHISRILDNDQLDAHLLYFTIRFLYSSTSFEHYMLIIRSVYCIDAASGIVTLSKWPSGAHYMSYRFSDSLRAGAYAPARKLSARFN
jgi:hypothetical protein